MAYEDGDDQIEEAPQQDQQSNQEEADDQTVCKSYFYFKTKFKKNKLQIHKPAASSSSFRVTSVPFFHRILVSFREPKK